MSLVDPNKSMMTVAAVNAVPGDFKENKERREDLYLRSRIFAGDEILQMVLEGRQLVGMGSNGVHPYGYFVEKIGLALKIVIPEISPDSASSHANFVDLHNRLHPSTKEGRGFGPLMKEYTKKYQTLKGLLADGIVGADTIEALDYDLTQIYYYDIEKQKAIHNWSKSIKVGHFTVVSGQSGANLRSEPSTDTHTLIRNLPFNTRVRIISILESDPPGQWCFVETDPETINGVPVPGAEEEMQGYVSFNLLWTNSAMPEPNAKLYKIQENEGLLEIARNHYPGAIGTDIDLNALDETGPDEEIYDARYYANLLLYANNPEGDRVVDQKHKKTIYPLDPTTGKYGTYNPTTKMYDIGIEVDAGIYIDSLAAAGVNLGWFDAVTDLLPDVEFPTILTPILPIVEQTWENWENSMDGTHPTDWQYARTSKDKYIWIPSQLFAESLKDVVDSGSIAQSIADAVENLKKEAKEFYNDHILGLVDQYWPVGKGVAIDVGAGGTFEIPVAVDLGFHMSMWRDSEDTFKLIRRGTIGGGLDTGVGIGGFLGFGLRSRRGPQTDSQYGVGVNLGAQITSQLAVTLHQEFEFKFREDYALVKLFFASMGPGGLGLLNPQMLVTSFLANMFSFNISSTEYLSKVSLGINREMSVAAVAAAGLKLGSDTGISYYKKGDLDSKGRNTADKNKNSDLEHIFSLLRVSFDWDMQFNIGGGIEVEFPEGWEQDTATGYKVPKKIMVAIGAEASVATSIGASITALDWSPDLDLALGGAIKFQFSYDYKDTDWSDTGIFPGKFELKKVFLAQKTGEFDVYQGPASENTIEILWDKTTLPTTVEQAIERIGSISFKQRIMLGTILGRRYKKLVKFQQGLTDKLESVGKPRWGLIYEGYYTHELTITPANVKSILEDIGNYLKDYRNVTVNEVLAHLTHMMRTGIDPDDAADLVVQGINWIYKYLDMVKIELHHEFGLGMAIGFNAALGLKVRAVLNASGRVTQNQDITQHIKDNLDSGEIQEAVRELVVTGVEKINDRFFSSPDTGLSEEEKWMD